MLGYLSLKLKLKMAQNRRLGRGLDIFVLNEHGVAQR